jgi:hypothetical protein
VRKLDLVGAIFGELSVLGAAPSDRYGHTMWACTCSCLKEVVVSTSNLRSGHTVSCGHIKRYKLRDYVRKHGPSRIVHSDPMVKMHNAVLRSYRQGAAKRGLDWGVDYTLGVSLITAECHFCGTPPQNLKKKASGKSRELLFWYNGIDRVDNSIGYVPGNIVTCCRICNRAKSDLLVTDFTLWLDRVTQHWSRGRVDGTNLTGEVACAGGVCSVV